MEDQECPICLIPFSDNNNAIITLHCCNHQFHSSCYIKCIKLKNECPLCRKNLNEQKEEECVIIPIQNNESYQNNESMLVEVHESRSNIIKCCFGSCSLLMFGCAMVIMYFFMPR